VSSTVRDLGSPDLWERSLERSLRRRELAAAARRELSRRRRASVAATAAVAVAPVATSVSFSSSTAAAAKAATQPMPHGDADPVLLVLGSTGPSVRQVQRALDLVVDGIYGPRTERAVRHFQVSSGLPATGRVDLRTWVALMRVLESRAATAPSPAPATPEPDVTPELKSTTALAPAPDAAEKPATVRKPAHARRAKKAAKPAARAPRHAVKRHAPSRAADRKEKASDPRPAASKAPAVGGSIGRILDAIASCESGGDPTAVGGGGRYRGLYQFDQQTWESLGGSGDPAAASPADQTRRAAMLYSQRGASAWPTCGPPAVQAASVSRSEAHDPGRPQQQEQPSTDRREAPPEVTAAAVEREPATSAAAPEPQETTPDTPPASQDVSASSQSASSADSAPSADVAPAQKPETTAASDDGAPSAQQSDASAQGDGRALLGTAPAAPNYGEPSDAGAPPDEPATVPVPEAPAPDESLPDLSSGGGDQPPADEAIEAPEPGQVPQPDLGPTPEPSSPVVGSADPPAAPVEAVQAAQAAVDGAPSP
jgi:peptidoglycan hydrolase-like protein with peptidoglycan-binding domain